MAEGEQAVEGVFGVEVIVGPMAVEAALGAPEGVDEIEALFARGGGEFALQAGQRVERGGGGEQVGERRFRHGEEAALGMELREEPVADDGVDRHAELVEQGDGGGGGVRGAGAQAAGVGPRAVGGFEEFEALHHAQRLGQFAAEILIRAEGDEAAVGIAKVGAFIRVVAAVARTMSLDPGEQRVREAGRHFPQTEGGPAAGERAEVDEVETRAVAVAAQPVFQRPGGWRELERFAASEGEDGVIKIGPTRAIDAATGRGELPREKTAHEFGGIPERLGRDAGDLEHFETQAHGKKAGTETRNMAGADAVAHGRGCRNGIRAVGKPRRGFPDRAAASEGTRGAASLPRLPYRGFPTAASLPRLPTTNFLRRGHAHCTLFIPGRVRQSFDPMKIVLSSLFSVVFTFTALAQGKVDFQLSDTVKTVLERQVGQKVELRLDGGEKIAGKVEKVGEKTVHLSAVAGQEFFDAVVVLEEVTAVLVRTK